MSISVAPVALLRTQATVNLSVGLKASHLGSTACSSAVSIVDLHAFSQLCHGRPLHGAVEGRPQGIKDLGFSAWAGPV